MNLKYLFLLFFPVFFLLFTHSAYADLMNPEYLTKKCQPGEQEIVCSYSRKSMLSDYDEHECIPYKNNASYYYLTGHGSTFGGQDKYCLKHGAVAVSNPQLYYNFYVLKNFIYALLITIILELIAALIYLRKNTKYKNILKTIIVANLISLPIVWFIIPQLTTIILLRGVFSELFAFLFEAIIIYYLNQKYLTLKQSVILSLIMNASSFIIGGKILQLII